MIVSACVALAACMGDKTEDQYRQSKVNEQMSNIQAVSGTYNGSVTAFDGTALGNLSLVMSADTQIQNSYDNTSSEQHAVVVGSVNYTGVANAQAVFQKAYYEPVSKIFKASVAVPGAVAGSTYSLTLSGFITNGVFSGQIGVDGFPNYNGSFSLVKNGPMAASNNLQYGRSALLSSEKGIFVGQYPYDGAMATLILSLQYAVSTPEQLLLNVFLPTRPVTVGLDFGDFRLTFNNAYIDDRTNQLLGTGGSIDGLNKTSANLTCSRSIQDNKITAMNCLFVGTQNQQLHVNLFPASSSTVGKGN